MFYPNQSTRNPNLIANLATQYPQNTNGEANHNGHTDKVDYL